MRKTHFGLIGSGARALYLIRHFYQHLDRVEKQLGKISIFERTTRLGMGMPYSPEMTDRWNLSNISSEELPCLDVTFAEWLRQQGDEVLEQWDIRRKKSATTPYTAASPWVSIPRIAFIISLRNSGRAELRSTSMAAVVSTTW